MARATMKTMKKEEPSELFSFFLPHHSPPFVATSRSLNDSQNKLSEQNDFDLPALPSTWAAADMAPSARLTRLELSGRAGLNSSNNLSQYHLADHLNQKCYF